MNVRPIVNFKHYILKPASSDLSTMIGSKESRNLLNANMEVIIESDSTNGLARVTSNYGKVYEFALDTEEYNTFIGQLLSCSLFVMAQDLVLSGNMNGSLYDAIGNNMQYLWYMEHELNLANNFAKEIADVFFVKQLKDGDQFEIRRSYGMSGDISKTRIDVLYYSLCDICNIPYMNISWYLKK